MQTGKAPVQGRRALFVEVGFELGAKLRVGAGKLQIVERRA